jgi:hypothetical protein
MKRNTPAGVLRTFNFNYLELMLHLKMKCNNCYASRCRDTAILVKQDVSDPKTAPVQSPWRDELLALLKTENTEHASGFNAGLRAAVKVLEQHAQDRQQRSARAIAKRKDEGKKTGGDLPYGYELAPDGETLREAPAEQRVIAAARKLRAEGHSLREVARRLAARKMFPREGAEFHAAQIKRMTDEET